jgi:hypothetical protein
MRFPLELPVTFTLERAAKHSELRIKGIAFC